MSNYVHTVVIIRTKLVILSFDVGKPPECNSQFSKNAGEQEEVHLVEEAAVQKKVHMSSLCKLRPPGITWHPLETWAKGANSGALQGLPFAGCTMISNLPWYISDMSLALVSENSKSHEVINGEQNQRSFSSFFLPLFFIFYLFLLVGMNSK